MQTGESKMQDESKMLYFQYFKEEDYPVFIAFEQEDFPSSTVEFIESLGFSLLTQTDAQHWQAKFAQRDHGEHARLLIMRRASSTVARQIEMSRPNDRFGQESLIAKDGHKVYRYRGVAMMVVSSFAHTWEMGCYETFGQCLSTTDDVDDQLMPYRIVMNRFLSWALAPLGVVGFWGIPVDEGAVVLQMKESKGETFYLDIFKRKCLSVDGVKTMNRKFEMLRLDSTLRDRQVVMRPDELSSFLSTRSSFMHEAGPTVPVRQVINSLAKTCQGVVYPRERFTPRQRA